MAIENKVINPALAAQLFRKSEMLKRKRAGEPAALESFPRVVKTLTGLWSYTDIKKYLEDLILVEGGSGADEGDERAERMHHGHERSAVDVLIHKVIYPEVSIQIGDAVARFDMALKGPIRIGRDEHQRLYFREGDGPIRSLDTVAKIVDRAA